MRDFIAQMAGQRGMQGVRLLAGLVLAAIGALAPSARASGVFADERVFVSQQQSRLIVNDYSLWHGGYNKSVWASVSVKDSGDNWVTGLTLDDFGLTEALLSPTQEVIQERTVTFDEPDYQFDGDGFWERSVTGHKIDFVFVVDVSGSMQDEIVERIRPELHDFVDRLQSSNVDFRIGVVSYSFACHEQTLPFRGVMQTAEIHEWVENLLQTVGGEGPQPTRGYDALMLGTEFDFREEAHNVMVVITDTVPQTVYGRWGASVGTPATMSAVKMLLEKYGIELFYSQPDEREDMDMYAREGFNPLAMETGFRGLEELGLAERITWPFEQEDVPIVIDPPPPTGNGIVDSQYYFAWVSRFDWPAGLEGYTVRVTVRAADPERPGEFLEEVFCYIPYQEKTSLTMLVTDEAGNPTDNVWIYLCAEMGDRKEVLYGEETPHGGVRFIDNIPVGRYYLVAADDGWWDYSYATTRYTKRERIVVPAEGLTLPLQVDTADREFELAKARGLLKELRNWGYCEKPFVQFADEAVAWLDELEQGGVDWREIEIVKRFSMALSAYVNTTGYAAVEVERAVEDFIEGSKEVRKLLKDLTSSSDDLMERILDPTTVALYVSYAIPPPNTDALAKYVAESTATELVLNYVTGPFMEEVPAKLVEILPVRSDLKALLRILVETIVLKEWDNTEDILKSVVDLAMNVALEEVKEALKDAVKQALLDALDSSIEVPEQARAILKAAISAFYDAGFDGWDEEFIQNLNQLVEDAITQLGGKDKLIEQVDNLFLKLHTDEGVGPGPLRDFVLPVTHMVVKVCVENYDGGEIGEDFVVEVLARMFCNWMALRPWYSEPLLEQMNETLHRAQHFYAVGTRMELYMGMMGAFGDFQLDIMNPMNRDAWDALALQDSIDNWENLLSTVEASVDVLLVTTALACPYYPRFCDMVDDMIDLRAFLEALRVMTNVLQFGMKLNDMASFTGKTQYVNPTVLPKYQRVTEFVVGGGGGVDITWRGIEGKRYRVQWKGDLANPEWMDLSEEILATGDTMSWTDTGAAAVGRRFYRVMQLE